MKEVEAEMVKTEKEEKLETLFAESSRLPAYLQFCLWLPTPRLRLGLRTGRARGALGSEEPELESMAVVLQGRPHCAQGDGCAQAL